MKSRYEKSWGLTPLIQIEMVGGSLQIKGWMRSEVYISSDDEHMEVVEKEEGILLRTSADCILRLPRAARLEIGQVGGNVRLKYLDAELRIGNIRGSLVCRSLANLSIGEVNGSMMIKDILGSITCRRVGASFVARHVAGDIELGYVAGNLDGRNLGASLSAKVGGFSRVEWNVFNGKGVTLDAGAAIHCEIPDTLQPRLNLHSAARQIFLIQAAEKKQIAEETYQTVLGEGLIPFDLSAGGKIVFVIRPPHIEVEEDLDAVFNEEVDQISEKVGLQFQTQIDAFQRQMHRFAEQMEVMEDVLASGKEEPARLRPAIGDPAARLQEKMRQAQERMEQKLADAQRRSEQKTKLNFIERMGFGRKREASREKSAAEPHDEERLFILKMLEQKKISVAEAEKLLAALEGNNS